MLNSFLAEFENSMVLSIFVVDDVVNGVLVSISILLLSEIISTAQPAIIELPL